ncbi:hypothetical protein F511_23242 [Dorcoceras hygrometricum]|uniref:Ubiquitin-like protease family profile domain-containing protein n=1 Tax=Dorcoceras hygrometricum TaxID=472368 RepID=A0A2Z7BV52_9LAMI|nr:hypothetical protein F511_23242 [Dorcoceras hygrometricum]
MTVVEAQLTMMMQQQANMMDILKSLQSDMLSFKRARSPVITTGGETAERVEEIPSTDSSDGFELDLSILPPVSEVTWTGLPEVAGWTKVARMFQFSPVRKEESGSRESKPEAEGAQVEGNQLEGSTKSIPETERSVDSNVKILLDLITPIARMMPHILVAMGVQTDKDTQWNIVRPKEFSKQSLSGECGVYAIAAATFTLANRNVYTLNDAVVADSRKFCTCSLWNQSWMLD